MARRTLEAGFRRAARALAVIVAALGVFVLALWLFDETVLGGLRARFAPSEPGAAVLFIFLGAVLWLAAADRAHGARRSCGVALAASSAAALVTAAIAPSTAAGVLFLGVGLLLDASGRPRAAQLASLPAAAIGFLSVCGYLYGAASLSRLGPDAYSALALLAASSALLAARPGLGLTTTLASDTAAGSLFRIMLPLVVLTPIAMGWIRLRGEVAGLYDTSMGLAMMAAGSTVLAATVLFSIAGSLRRSELRRRSAEREVARAADQFRLALEAAPTGMLMIDRAGRIVLVNAEVERMFGHARRELVGKSIDLLLPERHQLGERGDWTAVLSDGRRSPGRELNARRADGVEFPVEVKLSPVPAHEGDFVLSSIADISERKRGERERDELLDHLASLNASLEERVRERTAELSELLRERDVLLQEIHHRVKNNLQVISSMINMQMRQLEAGPNRDALTECQIRVQAIALIHETLYESKDYARVHFSDYARTLVRNVFRATGMSDAGVSLELVVDDLALAVDKAIPCGLVLNELLTNALKHAFVGGRRGTVRVELKRVEAGRLRLAVCDDGVGLPAGLDVLRGRSLGLRLVGTLAEQLHAELNVDGQSGATFALTFTADA